MGIHQIVAYHRLNAPLVEMRTVFHVGTLTTDITDATIAALAIRDAWETNLETALSNQWVMYQMTVRDVSTAGLPELAVAGFSEVTGAQITDPLPPQTTLALNFRGPSARPNRARKLMGGFTELNNVGGRPTALLRAALGDFADTLLNMGDLLGIEKGLVTVAWGDTPIRVVSANELNTFTVAQEWGSLKSRKPGHGI